MGLQSPVVWAMARRHVLPLNPARRLCQVATALM
jgi:hypothetical protein